MKSFLFLIIAIVFSITIISAVQKSSQDINVTLQATSKNVGSDLLKKSADVIAARLKQFGINSANVKILSDKGQILVLLPAKTDLREIEGLLISKGELSFYETYTHAEIADMYKPENQIFRLLTSDQEKNAAADPRVGCTDNENKIKAEEYLRSAALVKNSKLLWGNKVEKSGYCLYALKTDQDGKPLIVRSDIASINTVVGKDPLDLKIQIKLNSQAAKVFADATEKNLNKSIAIVIDDLVYSCPVVRSAIKEGNIEVTGNFTKNEVNYFPAVFNSPQLPVDFKILK
jgi:SecD/SecF fusion protein